MTVRTLTELYLRAVREHDKPVMFRRKLDGQWVDMSTREFDTAVREIAAGLLVYGVNVGDRVALLSENRVEWAMVDMATLLIGSINVPIYPTLLAEHISFILGDSEPVAVFCSTPAQVAKLDGSLGRVPSLRHLVSFEPADRANAMTLDKLRELGRVNLASQNDEIDRRAAAIAPDDVATLIYTSGTTGNPKGVMLTHGNVTGNVLAGLQVLDVHPTDTCLSFLPLSHILERMAGQFVMLHAGATICYAESVETVAANMIELSPTVMVSVPRLYEKIYARVLDAASSGSPLKKKMFFWARGVGARWTDLKVAGKPIPTGLEIQRKIADALVFKKLRKRTGGKLRFFVSGGAPLNKEIAEFFFSAGLPILEGYGLTETSPVIAVNSFEHFRPGTVGPPVPGCEVKIAADGEILTRSAFVMKGYWRRDDATAETIIDGWLYTGDIGHLDADGFLHITDRKKDIIVTAGGKNIAPQPVEAELKKSKYVGEAVLIGDKRRFLVALLVPNFETLDAFAHEHGIDTGDRAFLVRHVEVQRLFADLVHTVNSRLASFEQIKYFRVLDHEFTIDGGQLTPSMKVKRRVVNEKYKATIDEMFVE